MSEHFDRDQLACQEMLEAFGIDRSDVAIFGIGQDGYLRFRRSAFTGVIQVDAAGPVTDFCEWPKGFPVEEFLKHASAWLGRQDR